MRIFDKIFSKLYCGGKSDGDFRVHGGEKQQKENILARLKRTFSNEDTDFVLYVKKLSPLFTKILSFDQN